MSEKENQQKDYLDRLMNTGGKEEITAPPTPKAEHISEGEYLMVDLANLPLGIFYKPGTKIKIRAATVAEVEAYSVVDDKNYLDVVEKMNQLLSSCIRITFSNGKTGTYKDVKDGDRLFLIFQIRELTFQKGNSLAKDVQCDSCSHEFKIPFRTTANNEYPKTFISHTMPDKLKKYFNDTNKTFDFKIGGVLYQLAPPSIGIQEQFFTNIRETVQAQKKVNVSFTKIIPFIFSHKNSVDEKEVKEWEKRFKSLDMNTFQILNKAVDLMQFGLKELMMPCPSCGVEVHTDITFPDGASSLFVVSDPFDIFDAEQI
jgi:hypothetical protein